MITRENVEQGFAAAGDAGVIFIGHQAVSWAGAPTPVLWVATGLVSLGAIIAHSALVGHRNARPDQQ